MEANNVYTRISQRDPIFSPITAAPLGYRNWSYPNADYPSISSTAGAPSGAVIPGYVCPSAPRSENPYLETWSAWCCVACAAGAPTADALVLPYRAGANDYIALGGIIRSIQSYYNRTNPSGNQASSDGLLQDNGVISVAQVTDGTSTTIICGEMAGRPDLWILNTKKNVPTDLPTSYKHPGQQAHSNYGGCWSCFDNAENWIMGTSFDGKIIQDDYIDPPKPLTPVCFMNCANVSAAGLYSFHPSSAGIAVADGSAHMINQNLDVLVFARLVTYRGRHKVTDGNF